MKKKDFMNMFEDMAAKTVSFTYKGNTYSITDGKIQCTELMKPVEFDSDTARSDFLNLCTEFMPLLGIRDLETIGNALICRNEGEEDEG